MKTEMDVALLLHISNWLDKVEPALEELHSVLQILEPHNKMLQELRSLYKE